jgi:hypothetical protein
MGQNSRNALKTIRQSISRHRTSGSRRGCVECDSEYRLRSRNIVDRLTIPGCRPEIFPTAQTLMRRTEQ